MTIDSRGLNGNAILNDYVSYSSALLFRYCKIYGYDFIKLTPNAIFLSSKVLIKCGLNESIVNNKKSGSLASTQA